jgi:hypothetical protein
MGYFCFPKFNPVGKEIAPTMSGDQKMPSQQEEKLKNFDHWTEELSKHAFTQADEDDRKALLKADEIFVDDDFEEE